MTIFCAIASPNDAASIVVESASGHSARIWDSAPYPFSPGVEQYTGHLVIDPGDQVILVASVAGDVETEIIASGYSLIA